MEGKRMEKKRKKKKSKKGLSSFINRAECELLFLLKGQVSSLLAPFSVYYTCVT